MTEPPHDAGQVNIDLHRLLDTFEARRRYHHAALWEEEKHFTWLVSIIVPALAAILVTGFLRMEERLPIIMVGSALGGFVSCIGLTVVRRESVSFLETLQVCNRITAKLASGKGGVELPTYSVVPFEEARNGANHPYGYLIKNICHPSNLGVRDCFQLVFLVMAILFSSIFVVACLYLAAIYAATWGCLRWMI